MKTKKIIIEIPADKTLEEVQEILRDVANMIGKSIPRHRIAKAEEYLKNSVWPEGLEALL
ncbi:hypothetical protein [Chitinophaga barathri]|uniref:Uncharacterized protein n=1 Tax=Chitinophaga barathri TaxID=1647451 RepID=A0A3N4MRC8_9BACT|nr:hypothetical protein [Chitinophaga barathri]RPD37883.1 hypothetical protein EG028_27775 [Chitinophaga barathri]